MQPYPLRNWREGISDENDRGPGWKFSYGLNIHGRDNVLTPGSAAAVVLSSSVGETGSGTAVRGTTLTSHFNIFVPSFDGSTYCFGATGSIMAVSPEGYWTNVYNDDEGITGAGEFGFSDGSTYMLWTKSTSYARRQMGGTFDSSRDSGQAIWSNATQVWKTEKIQSQAVWHTVINASGSQIIANADSLSVIDFDGNFDPIKMSVRPGNLVNALEERDDYVIMGSERQDYGEEGHLWAWIVTALNYVQKKRVPAFGVNALITAEMSLLQAGDQGEIFPADFVNSVPIATIPGGGHTIPGGVTIHDDLATFGFSGGAYPGLWTYGRRNRNRASALNYQYRLTGTVNGSTVSTIGAVAVVNGVLLASYGTTDGSTSEYFVDAISATTRANAVFEETEYDKGAGWDQRMVDSVHVLFTPLVSGTSFSIKYKVDKQSSWQYAVFGDGSTTFSQVGEVEAIATIGKPSHVLEIGCELNSSGSDGVEIHEVTPYYADEVQKA